MASNTELNTGLVESFSSLEQLCNQIYNENHGVTSYIEEMESLGYSASRNSIGFDMSLHKLKEVRHKRNSLSHGTPFSSPLAESDDIEFINRFRSSILNQSDPISLHRKRQRAAQKSRLKVEKRLHVASKSTSSSNKGNKLNALGCTLAIIVSILVILLIVYTSSKLI